eukprot:gene3629-5646_t
MRTPALDSSRQLVTLQRRYSDTVSFAPGAQECELLVDNIGTGHLQYKVKARRGVTGWMVSQGVGRIMPGELRKIRIGQVTSDAKQQLFRLLVKEVVPGEEGADEGTVWARGEGEVVLSYDLDCYPAGQTPHSYGLQKQSTAPESCRSVHGACMMSQGSSDAVSAANSSESSTDVHDSARCYGKRSPSEPFALATPAPEVNSCARGVLCPYLLSLRSSPPTEKEVSQDLSHCLAVSHPKLSCTTDGCPAFARLAAGECSFADYCHAAVYSHPQPKQPWDGDVLEHHRSNLEAYRSHYTLSYCSSSSS